jgi:hypothetical protein
LWGFFLLKLSQSEDPPFTFKVMVVQTYWPEFAATLEGNVFKSQIALKKN